MSKSTDQEFVKYKFHQLNSYCDTEWLSDSKKKYRKVFNAPEIAYLYAEFSFYNKLFDEEDWDCSIKLVCNKVEGRRTDKICELKFDKKITKEENIHFLREGWGTENVGGFWKKGTYEWEAYIDEKFVGRSVFYVEEEEAVTDENNPFFSIEELRLFEADAQLPAASNRKYYTKFAGKDTRYVWGELTLKRKINKPFWCEIIFHFYNDEGQFKGWNSTVFNFDTEQREVTLGWGSPNPGTWFNNNYTIEILHMNKLLGVAPFEVGDDFEEGEPKMYKSKMPGDSLAEAGAGEINEAMLPELLAEMDKLTGMESLKKKVHDYINYLKFIKVRKEKGFEENEQVSIHAVLTGNPGTGKTTIARLLGKIYKAMGLLSKGHVVEVDRADLVAEYIGQTAPKVKKVIEKARGGILFIDEAYSLHRGDDDSRDFGREVIEILIKEMSDGKGDLAVLVAGYPKEMNGFLHSNPGMKSRFNHYFQFDDYTPDELLEIVQKGFEAKKLLVNEDIIKFLKQQVTTAYRDRDRTFGNARFALSIVNEAKMNMGLRLMQNTEMDKLTQEEMNTVHIEDVEKMFIHKGDKDLDIQIDNALLRDSLAELDALVGLDNVKQEIMEQVKLVKYYREIGKDVLNKFTLHCVFTGNPGTGKTTVARIYAKIYRALGVIERGHLVEVDREKLVAGFSGQTASKTAAAVDQAMGGVLFVDEAYALQIGSRDEFGMEAINTLLKRMEDHREDFIVIAAGYTDNMAEFLLSNPGLKSRFERVIEFGDYNPAQLMGIADKMLADENMKLDEAARAHLHSYLSTAYDHRDKYFGNAREVRKIIGEAIKNQNLRMASMDSAKRTRAMIETVTLDDLKEFDPQQISAGKSQGGALGFKSKGKEKAGE